jgi:hypothetical protein
VGLPMDRFPSSIQSCIYEQYSNLTTCFDGTRPVDWQNLARRLHAYRRTTVDLMSAEEGLRADPDLEFLICIERAFVAHIHVQPHGFVLGTSLARCRRHGFTDVSYRMVTQPECMSTRRLRLLVCSNGRQRH